MRALTKSVVSKKHFNQLTAFIYTDIFWRGLENYRQHLEFVSVVKSRLKALTRMKRTKWNKNKKHPWEFHFFFFLFFQLSKVKKINHAIDFEYCVMYICECFFIVFVFRIVRKSYLMPGYIFQSRQGQSEYVVPCTRIKIGLLSISMRFPIRISYTI